MLLLKKILVGFSVLLLILGVWQYDLLKYALAQGKGQFHILWNARPVEEYLEDPAVPDSIKSKLKYIQVVRNYAIDSLGLHDTDNYTTMFDQKGEPILWVVTGCKPYALEAKKWQFPIVGEVPYKGFFVEEKAQEEMEKLEAEGWDAGIRTVGGWSTLGWFKDPILSNMLSRSEGGLANLIIHELVHATIFVKDSVVFNENLASFIGDRGAGLFLRHHFGSDSPELKNYQEEMEDKALFIDHILRGADRLDSLYQSFSPDAEDSAKTVAKERMISEVINALDSISFSRSGRYNNRFEEGMPNNTFFMSYLRYQSRQSGISEWFEHDFGNDFHTFVDYLKNRY